VLCGDSTKAADLDRLLASKRAALFRDIIAFLDVKERGWSLLGKARPS
jgi:hypothetical protein